jgi:hypothetical protein
MRSVVIPIIADLIDSVPPHGVTHISAPSDATSHRSAPWSFSDTSAAIQSVDITTRLAAQRRFRTAPGNGM